MAVLIKAPALVLPQNGACLLMDVKPIDTTKPKIRRRKDLLLAASKIPEIFPKVVSAQTAKLEKFKLREHAY